MCGNTRYPKLRPKDNKEANLGILEHFEEKNLGILEHFGHKNLGILEFMFFLRPEIRFYYDKLKWKLRATGRMPRSMLSATSFPTASATAILSTARTSIRMKRQRCCLCSWQCSCSHVLLTNQSPKLRFPWVKFGALRKKAYLCANKRKKSIEKDKYIKEQNTGLFYR